MSYHPEMDYTLFFDTVHTILSSMAERYKLPLQTKLAALSWLLVISLTERYFCRFVEKVPIDCRRVNAYALVCMVIAMRYEECTDNLPTLDEMLSSYPECAVRMEDVVTMEEDILLT